MSKSWDSLRALSGPGPSSGTAPVCHPAGRTSPAEALTAFGYVTMKMCCCRFTVFDYGFIPVFYIYGILPELFHPKSIFYTFRASSNIHSKELRGS